MGRDHLETWVYPQTRETAQLDGAQHKSGEDASGEGGGEGGAPSLSSHGLPAGDAAVPITTSMSARAILAPP